MAHLSDRFADIPKQQIRIHAIMAFALPFVLYLFTAAHTVTFEDSGLFIMVSHFWGVAHPPGYPLYTLLCHLFNLLPFDTVAYRVNVFSALVGSVGLMFAYLIMIRFVRDVHMALAGTLLLAVASTVWNQLVIAKLYSLNFLFCIWAYYRCLRIREETTVKNFVALGLVSGLSLANHWPIFILNSPGYLCLSDKKWFTKKNILAFLAALTIGVVPYLIMYYRSKVDPVVAFLGPIQDFHDLIKYVARSYYSVTDASILNSSRDIYLFFVNFLRSFWIRDFIFLTVPLAVWGFVSLVKRGEQRIALSLVPMLLSTTFTLLFLLRLEYNDLDENIQRVYWIVPFFAYSVWVAAGAYALQLKFGAKFRFIGTAVLLICAVTQLVLYYPKNNMRDDDFAEAYARAALSHIPPNSDLIVSTDADVGPTGYTNLILGVNPTVKLFTSSSVFFKNRMFDPRRMDFDERVRYTTDFIQKEGRVYSLKGIEVFENQKNLPFQVIFDGMSYRYSVATEPSPEISAETIELSKKALDSYIKSFSIDNWYYHRSVLASRLCNLLVLKGIEDHPAFQIAPECMQVLSRHMANTNRREQADEMFMKWWRAKRYPIVTEKQQYLFYFLINRLELVNHLQGQRERQLKLLAEGIEIASTSLYDYPLCDNKIAPLIKSISGPITFPQDVYDRLKLFEKCTDNNKGMKVD